MGLVYNSGPGSPRFEAELFTGADFDEADALSAVGAPRVAERLPGVVRRIRADAGRRCDVDVEDDDDDDRDDDADGDGLHDYVKVLTLSGFHS